MKKFTLLFILFFGLLINQSWAQFTGKIKFNTYAVKAGHQQKKSDDATILYITPKRLFLQSKNSYKIGGRMKADGILVRNDKKDVVIFSGDNQAIKFTKAGITSFMGMMGSFQNKQASPNITYKKTGETKKINGYQCEKFIFKNKKEPNQHGEAWVTRALHINWGFLTDIWNGVKNGIQTGGNLPIGLIFKEGYFPVKWKQYKNNSLSSVVKAQITSTGKARSHVKIPSKVQVLTLQQYIMQQMSQNQ
jgi:GLPGLI family protein